MEAEGRYDEKQLALVLYKLEVAQKHSLGPYMNKKKKVGRKEDWQSLDLGSSLNSVGGLNDQRLPPALGYTPLACPIKTFDDLLTQDDVSAVLSKLSSSTSGSMHDLSLVKCMVRSQLGLLSTQQAHEQPSSSSYYYSSSSSQQGQSLQNSSLAQVD